MHLRSERGGAWWTFHWNFSSCPLWSTFHKTTGCLFKTNEKVFLPVYCNSILLDFTENQEPNAAKWVLAEKPHAWVWVREEKGDFKQWIRPEQIALGGTSVLKKPWGVVEPVASSNAILSSTPLQLPHVEVAFLLLGILTHLTASRNSDFYVKSPFENIWLNKNSGRKRKEKKGTVQTKYICKTDV